MIGPPGKKKRAVGSALKGNYPITYHTPLITQSWAAEAERLAKEFLRSHQARHLQALARHLDGVSERLTTGEDMSNAKAHQSFAPRAHRGSRSISIPEWTS